MKKVDMLRKFFKQNCSMHYLDQYKQFKRAKNNNSTMYPNFKFWLEHIDCNYNVLKAGIEKAGYKYPKSDRNWITAIRVYSEVGCNYTE